MKVKGICRRAICLVLCAALLLAVSPGYAGYPAVVKAFPVDTPIDEEKSLTETDIPDTILCKVLRITANYNKMRMTDSSLPALTGDEDLLSEQYDKYSKDSFTFGDLKAYEGVINLRNYADKITSIEGLGLARGAGEINIGACGSITAIPAHEFGKCAMTKITIPDSVTNIGEGAFEQCQNLTEVCVQGRNYNKSIADLSKIKNIGSRAFDGCGKLADVVLYDGTPEVIIGSGAFNNCKSINEVDIPVKSASHLGESAFAGCESLHSVTLMDELDYMPSNVFSSTALDTVKIYGKEYDGKNYFPAALTYIGKNAFQGAGITYADFSRSVNMSYIGEYAFAGTSMMGLTLPDGLKTIESLAFNVAFIPELIIPDSVTSIKQKAFYESHIMQMTVSANVSAIEEETFMGSDLLWKVRFNNTSSSPGKLTSIGKKAFKYCKSLKNISFQTGTASPSVLESIEDEAFMGCGSLPDTDFLSVLKNLKSIGESAFASCCTHSEKKDEDGRFDKNIYGEWNYTGLVDVVLPESVTTLGSGVFADNYALVSVNLGNGIEEIPENAFAINGKDASMLQKVILPKKLVTIQAQAFKGNSRLRGIGYTDGSAIEYQAGKAQFGDGLIYIGDNAFSGCSGKHVISNLYKNSVKLGGAPYTVYEEDIHESKMSGDSECLIYVPGEKTLRKAYFNLEGDYEDVDEEDGITIYAVARKVWIDSSTAAGDPVTIKLMEFGDADKGYGDWITNVRTVEGTSGQIRSSASGGASEAYMLIDGSNNEELTAVAYSGLENVVLPDSLTDTEVTAALGTGVFESCVGINRVTLSENINLIPEKTFYGCGDALKDWSTGENVEYTYTGLASVDNLANIKEIGDSSFYSCYAFNLPQSMDGGEISNSLETIGNSAFYNCRSLTSVVFHSALKSIGSSAFMMCAETIDDEKYIYPKNDGTEGTYTYRRVKEPSEAGGRGLSYIDFTYAKRLESIGSEAFSYTAVEVVNLPDALYSEIPDNMFCGCSLLKTVTIPDNVTAIGSCVFKDCENLDKLRMPVSAQVASDILSGRSAFVIPGLQMVVPAAHGKISVPVENSIVLPVNSLSAGNRSGGYKVTVYDSEEDTKGAVIYEDGVPVKGTKYDNIIGISIESGNEGKADVLKLLGGTSMVNGLIVKIEANSSFYVLDGNEGSIINSQTFIFNVDVTRIPAVDMSVTETSGSTPIISNMDAQGVMTDSMYFAKGQNPVVLSVAVEPSYTSDLCKWSIDNPEVVSLSDAQFADGAGAVTLTPLKIGNTKLTITCGAVTHVIYLYVKIPASSISASTESTVSTNSSESFDLPVGGTDQITIVSGFDRELYTEEEWLNYGDTIIFTSSDPEIATVSSSGVITAKKEGTVQITVSAPASHKEITFNVTVVPVESYNPTIGRGITEITGVADIYVGQSLQLGVKLNPSKATNAVKWSISGEEATISESGLVTAGNSPGSVKVTATMLDAGGKETTATATATIKILQAAASIALTPGTASLNLYAGNTVTLARTTNVNLKGYSLVPSTSTDSVKCASSNNGVAECSESGSKITIKATGQGTANVTLTATSGVQAVIQVSVIDPITGIKLQDKASIAKGSTLKLVPELTPANSIDTYTWSTSKESVAQVNENGVVKGVGNGTARIMIKSSKGITAYCTVTVYTPAKSISFRTPTNQKKIYMSKGSRITVSCECKPSDSTDTVKYTSNKKKIVSVAGSGSSATLTAKKPGTAKITVKSGSGKKAVLTVKVVKKAKASKKVKISGKKSVKVKKTIQLTAKITKKTSTDTVRWTSSKSSVASVDAYGRVIGIAKGKCKITATTSSGKSATINLKVKK